MAPSEEARSAPSRPSVRASLSQACRQTQAPEQVSSTAEAGCGRLRAIGRETSAKVRGGGNESGGAPGHRAHPSTSLESVMQASRSTAEAVCQVRAVPIVRCAYFSDMGGGGESWVKRGKPEVPKPGSYPRPRDDVTDAFPIPPAESSLPEVTARGGLSNSCLELDGRPVSLPSHGRGGRSIIRNRVDGVRSSMRATDLAGGVSL